LTFAAASDICNNSNVTPEPWLPNSNYFILQALFSVLPHSVHVDTTLEFINRNRLVSTWIFALVFYLLWRIEDPVTEWRRGCLLQVVIAFGVAVAVTIAIRPWIRWPAPAMQPRFRDLYPRYFWGNGAVDSFPSHSTLTYLVVSLGIWSVNRRASVILTGLVAPLIMLPRIYVGGHYPIDVVASILLAVFVVWIVRRWDLPLRVTKALGPECKNPLIRETLLLLWVFELGQEFGGLVGILSGFQHQV
jgi:membrane-associated phospholipid phosphatase